MAETRAQKLKRFFSPTSIAFVGGSIAQMAIQRCIEMGYEGQIWPVHPKHKTVAGYPCYASIEELPGAPDATYVGVNRELTIEVVKSLSAAGGGGAVCYAAGFSEMGEQGEAIQQKLVAAAGDMPLIGPNTFGFINYLGKCALWPYLFGGEQVQRGPALISQSGNIAMNLTMNQRSVNFTHVIGTGNQAVLGAGELIDALLQDDRVSVIGMYVEGFDDIESFSRAALKALHKGVPIVVTKMGKTQASAQQSSSHTSSLTGSDTLHDSLFERLGVIRVSSLNRLLETVKVLDLSEPLEGNNILSLSCSGGEAAIIADLAPEYDLTLQPFSPQQTADLQGQFGNFVTVSNPFDYNTSIWGDQAAQQRCFSAAMAGNHNAALLVYDHPTVQAAEVDEWVMALDAFIAAHKKTGMAAFVICTISELLPESMRKKLISEGVVPLQGFDDGLSAFSAAVKYYRFRATQRQQVSLPRFPATPGIDNTTTYNLDEWQSKCALNAFGLTTPTGAVGTAKQAPAIADQIGYPVVVKAAGTQFMHKSDLGAVMLNLADSTAVAAAVNTITDRCAKHGYPVEQFLIEKMTTNAVAELIVGIKTDEQFGPALVIGAGGILVELVADSVSLLLPTDRAAVIAAINALSIARLINGFRGSKVGDLSAAVDAILAIADYALSQWDTICELDVNPLLVLPEGEGVVAVDALINLRKQ